MLILPVEEAKAGMTLAAPVTHPERPDQDLLKSGFVLTSEVIARLAQMSVAYLYIDYPGLDDLDRHLAANLSPARQKLYSQIKETIVSGQKRTRPAVAYTDYYATMRELIVTLVSQGQHPIYIEHMSRMGDDAVTHATAVAHLGLLLGMKLERYLIEERDRLPPKHAKEVVNIGVAGMLHDMGKLTLPPELQKHTGINPPDGAEALEQWQGHARQGYELIRNGVEPSAATAVLNHHQRYGGGGFPDTIHTDGTRTRYAERQIHIFSRIIAVADLYDRLATLPGSPARRPNLQVLHTMRTAYASWCDPVVLKMLETITPPFPPGQIVKLSDGTAAVVVEVESRQPYQPMVKRMTGDDRALSEEKLDLRKPDMPWITHVGNTRVEGLIPSPASGNAPPRQLQPA